MYMYEKNWNEFLVREVTGGTTQLILSAYVAADYNLVYSSPKMFYTNFQSNLEPNPWFKTIFLNSYLSFFLFVASGSW